MTSTTDALGNTTSYVNCPCGLAVFATAPDPATGQDDPGSPVTRYGYDAAMNNTATIDPLGPLRPTPTMP